MQKHCNMHSGNTLEGLRMDKKVLFNFAEDILAGKSIGIEQYKKLAEIPEQDVSNLFPGADMLRNHYFGREVHLCCICNGKSGRCSEDCSFCSQSSHVRTEVDVYPLLGKARLQHGGHHASTTPINRYSIVTSGKGLPQKDVKAIAEALSELDRGKISTCASLGILNSDDFEILKNAGVSRYHHNLETAESHFPQMCSTHTYKQRVDTILAAKEAGLSVCAGGVFGIGETDEQILELALALKELDVDSVPLNFLVPVKGTRLENRSELTPMKCLKTISIFRYILPNKEILICGGREANLGDRQSKIFYAGASGLMTGDYLTTTGRTLQKDLQMIEQLGFTVRAK